MAEEVGKMTDYSWLPLSEIAKYEPEMKRLGVSKVARSRGGFLTAYKRFGVPMRKGDAGDYWPSKRRGFIARHMAQYRKNPTYRRWLALVAWAYMPDSRFG